MVYTLKKNCLEKIVMCQAILSPTQNVAKMIEFRFYTKMTGVCSEEILKSDMVMLGKL